MTENSKRQWLKSSACASSKPIPKIVHSGSIAVSASDQRFTSRAHSSDAQTAPVSGTWPRGHLLDRQLRVRNRQPSDKDKLHPQLTPEEVAQNGRTYAEQAYKVLDPSNNIIRYNADWLSKLNFPDLIKLASNFTIEQFLARENFKLRWEHRRRYLSSRNFLLDHARL